MEYLIDGLVNALKLIPLAIGFVLLTVALVFNFFVRFIPSEKYISPVVRSFFCNTIKNN